MGGGFLREYEVNEEPLGGEGEYDYGDEAYYEYGDGEGGEYGVAYDYEGEEGADTKLPEEEDYYADYEREKKRRRRRRKRAAQDSSYDYEDEISNEVESEDYEYSFVEKGGALQTNKTWLFNGNTWEEKTPMSIPRDRPACSIINMPDGEV